MRALLPILILALSLGLAGCSKPPAATPTGNASTTTTTPTATATTPSTPTAPTTPPPPKEVKSGTTDFSQNNPAQPLAPVAITIDPGYATVTLNVTFSCASATPACLAANGVTVKAAGVTCTIPDGPIQAAIVCAKPGPATPGPAKVEFSGNGLIAAKWQVMES